MQAGDSGSGGGQDFDLNLAPIIDCFTVLITFMLVSASFLALGVFDAGAGAAGVAAASAQAPAITLEVELQANHQLQVKVSGKASLTKRLPAQASGEWDVEGLNSELGALRKKYPDTQSIILSASNDIEYAQVIRIMESTRKVVPAVLLGGF